MSARRVMLAAAITAFALALTGCGAAVESPPTVTVTAEPEVTAEPTAQERYDECMADDEWVREQAEAAADVEFEKEWPAWAAEYGYPVDEPSIAKVTAHDAFATSFVESFIKGYCKTKSGVDE